MENRSIEPYMVNRHATWIRSTHQQRVDAFMRLAGQDVPEIPVMPSNDVRKLRAKLIFEEAMETINALGVQITVRGSGEVSLAINHPGAANEAEQVIGHSYDVTAPMDFLEVIDGCCDIKVVTTGTLSACGVADQPVQYLIDANNLAKFGPGHRVREDGKLIKPPGHKPPDLAPTLIMMGASEDIISAA